MSKELSIKAEFITVVGAGVLETLVVFKSTVTNVDELEIGDVISLVKMHDETGAWVSSSEYVFLKCTRSSYRPNNLKIELAVR